MFRIVSFGAIPFILLSVLGLHSNHLFQDSQRQTPKSEQQAEHGKLYRGYKGIGDLRSIAAKSSGDVEVLAGIGQKIFFPDTPAVSADEFIARLAKGADTIVIGTVLNQSSSLTAEGTFIFTDSSVSVEQDLKVNATAPVYPSSVIIVTRPGGMLELSGHRVKTYDEALPPLEVGQTYLLFLSRVQPSGGYTAFEPGGVFRVDGQKAKKMTKEQLPGDLDRTVDLSLIKNSIHAALTPAHPVATFIGEVRAAILDSCCPLPV